MLNPGWLVIGQISAARGWRWTLGRRRTILSVRREHILVLLAAAHPNPTMFAFTPLFLVVLPMAAPWLIATGAAAPGDASPGAADAGPALHAVIGRLAGSEEARAFFSTHGFVPQEFLFRVPQRASNSQSPPDLDRLMSRGYVNYGRKQDDVEIQLELMPYRSDAGGIAHFAHCSSLILRNPSAIAAEWPHLGVYRQFALLGPDPSMVSAGMVLALLEGDVQSVRAVDGKVIALRLDADREDSRHFHSVRMQFSEDSQRLVVLELHGSAMMHPEWRARSQRDPRFGQSAGGANPPANLVAVPQGEQRDPRLAVNEKLIGHLPGMVGRRLDDPLIGLMWGALNPELRSISLAFDIAVTEEGKWHLSLRNSRLEFVSVPTGVMIAFNSEDHSAGNRMPFAWHRCSSVACSERHWVTRVWSDLSQRPPLRGMDPDPYRIKSPDLGAIAGWQTVARQGHWSEAMGTVQFDQPAGGVHVRLVASQIRLQTIEFIDGEALR